MNEGRRCIKILLFDAGVCSMISRRSAYKGIFFFSATIAAVVSGNEWNVEEQMTALNSLKSGIFDILLSKNLPLWSYKRFRRVFASHSI